MTESPLMAKILQVVQEYERDSQQRLEASERRARALEEENKGLHTELKKRTSVWGEIADDVLRERLRRLGSPPLDALIREAGVVLEDRLRRVASDAEGRFHGVGLVDAVFNSKNGMLIISQNHGEQEGVALFYRGAMQFIRNPPMHRLIEYPESTARLFLRLIDSLLQLLSELGRPPGDEVTVDGIRHMLTRIRIPKGQLELYKALYSAGDQALSSSALAAAINRTRQQVAGVLGALGLRINNTEGLEGKGGILVILDISEGEEGDWDYRMKPILREALEAEKIV
jgi:hypothetical protein